MLHRLLTYLAAHIEDLKLVAKFLGGLAVSFGAIVGGVIGWRRLTHERKQEDLRIVKPTMDEIEKFGQPIRSDRAERKIGGILTAIIGTVYTYILLKYMHGTSASGLPATAVIVFNLVGIVALAQGLFHPLGHVSISMWNRYAWVAAGVATIGTGTFVGVSTAPHPIPESALSPVLSEQRRRPEIPEESGVHIDHAICRQMSASCIALRIKEKDGVAVAGIKLSDVFGSPLQPSPKNVTVWIKGGGGRQKVEFTAPCFEREPAHRIHVLGGFMPPDWEEVSINWIVTECETFEPDPSVTILIAGDNGEVPGGSQTIFLDKGTVTY